MLVCSFVCANRTRDRGCSKHPVFPAPSDFKEGKRRCKPRAIGAARTRRCVIRRMGRAKRNPSSHAPALMGIASLHPSYGTEIMSGRHCEERSDEAIHLSACRAMDCFASLAMTWREPASLFPLTLRRPRSGPPEGRGHHQRGERDCPRNRRETRADRMSHFAMQQKHQHGPC
jgi:hypothetical protein